MYDLPVYLLDLCIFSYHLHSQTLIWPMDPYYEQMSEMGKLPTNRTGRRHHLMAAIQNRQWLPSNGQATASSYHGPGACMRWEDNETLHPVVARYDRLYPWRPSFTRPNRGGEPWLIYNTPVEITDRITSVYMVRYDNTGPKEPWPYIPLGGGVRPLVVVDPIHAARPALAALRQPTYQAPPASDLLYCFEGGTGGSDTKKAPVWSMMGYVLAKVEMIHNQPVYDVFIVFRGSRSGKLRPGESLFKNEGNADWVTDLMNVQRVKKDPVISRFGSVCIGFRSSLKTMLPTIVASLQAIQRALNAPPRYIYVTGHSLGGALAGQFASAMLLGTEYGPKETGELRMPGELHHWPWETMRLVTFGAPIVGGETFHKFFDHVLPSHRIWLEGDPITQKAWHFPVGIPYQIPKTAKSEGGAISHEPYKIRKRLVIDRKNNGYSVSSVPAQRNPLDASVPAADEPWVFKKTFAEVLDYFEKPGGRKNIVSLSQCLGAGTESSFASEFQGFVHMLDQQDEWTSPLVKWIDTIPPVASPSTGSSTGWTRVNPSLPAFPFDELKSLPDVLRDIKTYLAVCLVLCALSKGRSLSDVQALFTGDEKMGKFWKKIQEFQ